MKEQIDVKYIPIWNRYLDMFREANLSNSQAGQLLFMMMEYQFTGREPETVPKALRMVWVFLRKDLDDARGHYEMRVQNGRKGGRKKKQSDETGENRDDPITTGMNREEVMSTSSSTSSSTSTSSTTSPSKDTGSAPADAAGVCPEKSSYGEFGWVKLTEEQYRKRKDTLGPEVLHRCITYVDEAAQSNGNRNRWKDWYLILRRCHTNRWYETKHCGGKEEIPKGASGVLGEAELEAIRRVLGEEP